MRDKYGERHVVVILDLVVGKLRVSMNNLSNPLVEDRLDSLHKYFMAKVLEPISQPDEFLKVEQASVF